MLLLLPAILAFASSEIKARLCNEKALIYVREEGFRVVQSITWPSCPPVPSTLPTPETQNPQTSKNAVLAQVRESRQEGPPYS